MKKIKKLILSIPLLAVATLSSCAFAYEENTSTNFEHHGIIKLTYEGGSTYNSLTRFSIRTFSDQSKYTWLDNFEVYNTSELHWDTDGNDNFWNNRAKNSRQFNQKVLLFDQKLDYSNWFDKRNLKINNSTDISLKNKTVSKQLNEFDFEKYSLLILPTLITITGPEFTEPEKNISFYNSIMISGEKLVLTIKVQELSSTKWWTKNVHTAIVDFTSYRFIIVSKEVSQKLQAVTNNVEIIIDR
ncbi:hypothetical protein EI74_0378 [Mycoplasma testudineum]|uniref:Lipoprotein n=1 Tax=Mycoplasma testudineum TaxID=244584 RepID=A0A4R6IES7_9MOLU|nr:hypothetical protein [Mycoplasma testudineum]OYD26994.1 hypothetical protein CG473_01515 [Mycoplasma testudineum]TDO20542.1 hypothetical protein EI74_0378 [Mycoplasma testudineum]